MSLSSHTTFGIGDLQDVLDRGMDRVGANFRQRWSKAGASFEMPIVLHGSGELGRRTLDLFRKAIGTDPVAFTDNNHELWGTSIGGIVVTDPGTAIEKWGITGVFVATLYNPAPVVAQLRRAGASIAVPWHWMFAADDQHFLPYWSLDIPERVFSQPERVIAGAEIWADEASRSAYLEQLRWLMTLDSDSLMPRLDLNELYFDHKLIELSNQEVFVDCGAFDGDSFSRFQERTSGAFDSAHLIEPDPDNFRNLARWHSTLSVNEQASISLQNCALGSEEGLARFTARGNASSSLDPDGGIVVQVSRLDSLVPASKVTFVKVDVEGGEIEVLKGASAILDEGRSTWAVMSYHRPEHLWEIPLELAKYGRRDLYLRRYAEDSWERCIYAVAQPK